jgi:hypothetical protein
MRIRSPRDPYLRPGIFEGANTVGYDMYVQGAPDSEHHSYLRRGVFAGTVELRVMLIQLGMGFDSPMPEFPENDFLDRTDFRDDEPLSERAKLYMQALERTLADHGTGDAEYVPGIPTHKLASSDAWLVTAQECAEALAAYDKAMQAGIPHPETFADDVIPFLRCAANYEGFRVH